MGKCLGARPCHQSSSLFCCLNEIAQHTENLSNTPIVSLLVTGVLLPGSIEGWVLGVTVGPGTCRLDASHVGNCDGLLFLRVKESL